MRTITLLIFIVLCVNAQLSWAQNPTPISPDSIYLSDNEIKTIFTAKNDTLGFRKLTSKTSLEEYKGKENRKILRTMRNIQSTMDYDVIRIQIAGNDIIENTRYDQYGVLLSPKYKIINNGVILIGERYIVAPWNDIVSDWKTAYCYFVGFDNSLKLVRSVHFNPKPNPIDIVEFMTENLRYIFTDTISEDSTIVKTPPVFLGGEDKLKRHFELEIRYPMVAIENHIQGTTVASFTINPDSSITEIHITRGVDPSLDKELKRVIQTTKGMWKPGTVNGKETTVDVSLSVRFYLKEL